MGTSWIVAGVGGPALGGFVAEHWHWSVIFWLNVPLGLIAALLTHRSMKLLPRHDRPHRLDLVGSALMIAAATLFLIALTSRPRSRSAPRWSGGCGRRRSRSCRSTSSPIR